PAPLIRERRLRLGVIAAVVVATQNVARRLGDIKAVFGSWGLRNARPLALHRKERPPRAPLPEQRKKATLNAAHERVLPRGASSFRSMGLSSIGSVAYGVFGRQRSGMALGACLDVRPGRSASDALLSGPSSRVGHPRLCSLCGESRQTREEARPFSVAALSSGPVPLSSGSHQVAPSLRRSSA